jgi:hypothetical protein
LSYAEAQLLPKIHEHGLEILDGAVPALIPSSPFMLALCGTAVRRSFFGEVGLFWDTTFRVLQGVETWVIVVRCNYLERGFRRQV